MLGFGLLAARTKRNTLPALSTFWETGVVPDLNFKWNPSGFLRGFLG